MKKLLYIFCIALAMVGCARMGQPDGGWYDDDPPKVVSCIPADQATNVSAKKITILFDEYIKLTDATNKVIVSPPQLEVPDIKATGKKIVVELQDSLMANTTYTISCLLKQEIQARSHLEGKCDISSNTRIVEKSVTITIRIVELFL